MATDAEFHIKGDFHYDEEKQHEDRTAQRGDDESSEEDCDVEDDDAAVGGFHYLGGGGAAVLAFADEIPPEGKQVAGDDGDHKPFPAGLED